MSRGATVLDVRTAAEFARGHLPGARNVPLEELPGRRPEVTRLPGPVLVCCASGRRSRRAARLLAEARSDVIDAGSWHALAPPRDGGPVPVGDAPRAAP